MRWAWAQAGDGALQCRHANRPDCPVLQNLEVLYRQYGRDGNKHGLDWQEVAVAIIQDGVTHCDASVMAASTVQVGSATLLQCGAALLDALCKSFVICLFPTSAGLLL